MESKAATVLSIEQLATLANDAFTGYIGNLVSFTGETLTKWLQNNFISLPLSHVFFSPDNPDEPIAFGLIALDDARPGKSRLGAMGVVPAFQGKGVGGRALTTIIDAERRRGVSLFELEVIQQNTRGVQLYKRAGFTVHRELLGWQRDAPGSDEFRDSSSELKSCSFEDVDKLVKEHGATDLPWQAWGFVKNAHAKTHRAFQLGNAYCVVSNPEDDEKDTVGLQSLIVAPSSRGKGEASQLIKALMTRYPTKKWMASPIFPKEYGDKIAAALGFSTTSLTQYQMYLKLD
ncbi:acetyltransferase, gnat family [Purpureocillium lavendulum]|uniref:Acetyltransferase, gnat family n=1 Tax=Purpureocillium lavendulum TaxID=1247861 RepID=A0AB34FN74_9HYPO|nr:acetyltransferase, gnat family [Purpureocillium lavendulum]